MGRVPQVRNYLMAEASWEEGYPKVRWAAARASQLRGSGPHLEGTGEAVRGFGKENGICTLIRSPVTCLLWYC